MEDTAEDVKRKIKNAFCEEKTVEKNPVLDICKNIIFGKLDCMKIGDKEYADYKSLEDDYIEGVVHPS